MSSNSWRPGLRAGFRRVTALAVLVAALSAGCGGDKVTNSQFAPPGWGPPNSTPAGALARFEAAYEQKRLAEYMALFTGDFHFRFSSQADPLLDSQYGVSWGSDDESASTQHLFAGFTQTEPPFETFGPASAIALALSATSIVADPDHADSTSHYRLAVVPNVDLTITVPMGGDETIFEVSAPHDIYLVRGDAAFLADARAADSLHWYIRRWDDKSPAWSARIPGAARTARGVGPDAMQPATSATWGSLKNVYR